MQKFIRLKQFVLLLGLLLPAVWCGANDTRSMDGYSSIIIIKVGDVQSAPKGSSIQASINDHCLMVTFTENLGQVTIEVATATGATVDCLSVQTPNGYLYFITDTGDYIVTFTFPDGDVYYGEFTVTD
ncbi:MAG: DUF3244 domain-containing protein [Bacteroidales bacterium]|nr:DUF3244 domain-containing protein [Bacteroidales bacterium]